MFDNDDNEAQVTRLQTIAREVAAINETAEKEGRQCTEAENAKVIALGKEFDQVEAAVNAGKVNARMREPQPRRSIPDDVRPYNTFAGGKPTAAARDSWGWSSSSEFMRSVFNAARGAPDRRLMNAASTFGSEGINQDGGFAVPPDFRQTIMDLVRGDDALQPLCDEQPTMSNSLTLPLDATAPHDFSNGIAVNWTSEGTAITQSKPKLSAAETKLHKLAALVPMTDELLEDAPAVANWLPGKVAAKLRAKINDAIISGNGIGKPTGLLNSTCKITVDAVGGQGAGTIITENVLSMWKRLPTASRANARWLVHPDAEAVLPLLKMPGSTNTVPIFLPGGTLMNAGGSRLLGAPIVVSEACAEVGTEGDILLVDLKQYLIAMKVAGVRADVSIHVFFDQHATAFRFSVRLGGQSYWPTAVARQNGSSTMSPIISLSSTRT